ncbi:MAG: ADP-forming succinate--CoA ligase subunit beta [Spirochaetales bacterium]|jgi:succinyl-CoA synthetase beta subunit|nr:ADP-forming succinate--CoA ligase subunit beta [Spirochaetales bacterium]
MKVHEYQGHELFKQYGIPVSKAVLAHTTDEAVQAASEIGYPLVVKAQVLVGGRGKAGGVKVAKDETGLRDAAEKILGLTIKDLPVEKILLAEAVNFEQEYYLGLTVDRNTKGITLMLSAAGGVEIEELAVSEPEKILKLSVFPHAGINDAELDAVLSKAFENDVLKSQARDTVFKLYNLFLEKDCSLVEINPYARLDGDRLVALDAKVNFDDSALFKHEDVQALQNPEEYSADEIRANEVDLSFVSMDGDIGCIVNGAGLAMATMDLIKHFGGDPANFLDVGGSSNPEKVLNAFSIILNNSKVKAILINIFGGITRCDDIANGILLARKQIDIPVPVVIRLIGTNDKEGREILTDAGLSALENLTEAVRKVVAVSREV